MEDDLKKIKKWKTTSKNKTKTKMEDDLKKTQTTSKINKWKTTSNKWKTTREKNGRRVLKKMEDDLNKQFKKELDWL